MNSTSLLALIVDQHAGELAPEAAELLEAYLAQSPTARAEAERIRSALALTEQTVLRHPELARAEATEVRDEHACFRARRPAPSWLARAASIAVLAALTGIGGFVAGQRSAHPPVAAPVAANVERPPREDSPWARYRFASDGSGGGLQVVRLETAADRKGVLQ
jgi:hypothetical protein